MEEKQYTVGANLLQELANYLASRPYLEVSGLMNKLLATVEAQNKQVKAGGADESAEG
jgi:hypothetical protein